MAGGLNDLEQHLQGQSGKPPLHLWHPELSGDMDIVIKANGDWVHEGTAIKRKPLVKLFASILRREEDGEYYLLTPVEKWRIQVEQTALTIVDMDIIEPGRVDQKIRFTSNVDEQYTLGKKYPLTVSSTDSGREPLPVLALDQQLTAKLNRAVFYRLADLAVEKEGGFYVTSDGVEFKLDA
ncbi:DUF1285 domain-containing protein [Oceanicoccus sagamiensis]|uniref:Proteophosphoglycan n=1 Tax=Oceanicoccus sagamiensis TaxID=716816 RepID=A0A1X9NEJ0_9GAMM|nr:DUF1285 domain-containing protein [Oceanicoccus sagamiensis]ARN76458.1 hypothetical protein BST96_16430 [Oceanicoccus sagamiensis]